MKCLKNPDGRTTRIPDCVFVKIKKNNSEKIKIHRFCMRTCLDEKLMRDDFVIGTDSL